MLTRGGRKIDAISISRDHPGRWCDEEISDFGIFHEFARHRRLRRRREGQGEGTSAGRIANRDEGLITARDGPAPSRVYPLLGPRSPVRARLWFLYNPC